MTEAWPEDLLASNHRKWRTLSEQEWEVVRRAYLAGVPARELADRHDVGLSTLRQRARDGGWRRVDQPFDSDLFPADADRRTARGDEDDDLAGAVALAAQDWEGMLSLAQLRLRRALGAGQATEAGSWMRLYDRLAAHRSRCPDPEPDPAPDPEPAFEPEPQARPDPDPAPAPAASLPAPSLPVASPIAVSLEAVEASMRNVQSIARRAFDAAARGDGSGLRALETEIEALEALADSLPDRPPPAAPASDSSDSLDAVFSPPVDFAAERARLTTLRRRRIELGLGVVDIDASLAALAYEPPDG